MNSDFRVSVSLMGHPKALKLMRRCGDIAFYNLLKFWSFVAQNRPDGILCGLDEDDIELACDWRGDAGAMLRALLDLSFVDEIDGVLHVHDWQEHNGYACHAKERSKKAKIAAETRWNKKNGATSIDQAMLNDATSNAPSPSPSPSPNKLNNTPLPPKGGTRKKIEYSESFNLWWSVIPKEMQKGKTDAYKKWQKIGKSKIVTPTTIIDAIKNQTEKSHFRGVDGKDYFPNAATWLNNGRWDDTVIDKRVSTTTTTYRVMTEEELLGPAPN